MATGARDGYGRGSEALAGVKGARGKSCWARGIASCKFLGEFKTGYAPDGLESAGVVFPPVAMENCSIGSPLCDKFGVGFGLITCKKYTLAKQQNRIWSSRSTE